MPKLEFVTNSFFFRPMCSAHLHFVSVTNQAKNSRGKENSSIILGKLCTWLSIGWFWFVHWIHSLFACTFLGDKSHSHTHTHAHCDGVRWQRTACIAIIGKGAERRKLNHLNVFSIYETRSNDERSLIVDCKDLSCIYVYECNASPQRGYGRGSLNLR